MTLNQMLTELREELLKIDAGLPTPVTTWAERKPTASALEHLAVLQGELAKEPEKRTKSIIKSSWGTVKKTCESYGLFAKYKGDESLRNELKIFLGVVL